MFRALEERSRSFNLARKGILLTRAVSQSPGHISNGAFRPIFNQRCHLSCAAAPIALKDILNNFFSATGFKINIDIGFFITQRREKTLEGQVVVNRVHCGDVEQETHCRISSRSAALTEDSAGARETHDVVDNQKIPRKVLTLDHIKFLGNTGMNLFGSTGIASWYRLCDELPQITHRCVSWGAYRCG